MIHHFSSFTAGAYATFFIVGNFVPVCATFVGAVEQLPEEGLDIYQEVSPVVGNGLPESLIHWAAVFQVVYCFPGKV